MRRPMIAGNWKLHKTRGEAKVLIETLNSSLASLRVLCSFQLPAIIGLRML